MNIILLGAPGSGKGSTSEQLISRKGMTQLSTGDLFRKNIAEKTALGLEAQKFMNAGKYVPDEITNGMVEDYLQTNHDNLVFDGFPRTRAQAEALDKMLEKLGTKIDKVIYLHVDEEVLFDRFDRVINEGDLVSIDAGCKFEGWHADSAITVICGNTNNEKYDILVKATEQSLKLAIEQIKAGVRIGTLSSTVQNYIEDLGFHLPTDYSGHGIGQEMHEDPNVPNVGIPNTGLRLVAGMVICIEPMVQIGTRKTVTAKDGWTVSSADGSMTAHFEHTILVTEDGYEVLTLDN
jgi:methionine aminopeptidase type I